jgi:ABC-type branched-subunit amino acid transport system substrate-binding protein
MTRRRQRLDSGPKGHLRWRAALGALAAVALMSVAAGCSSSATGATSTSAQSSASAGLTGTPVVAYTFADVNTQGPAFPSILEVARIYGDWINAHGGINGHPLEVRTCDALGTPTGAAACAHQAVAAHAVAVVGSFTYGTGDAIVPVLKAANIAYFGLVEPLTPAEYTSSNVFPMGNGTLWADGMIMKAVQQGCKKIGVLLIAGTESFEPSLNNAAKAMGTTIAKYVVAPDTSSDYSPQVAQVTTGTDCVAMIMAENNFVQWMRAWSQAGTNERMYGPYGNFDPIAVKGYASNVQGDVVALYGYTDTSLSAWNDYRTALQTYHANPAYYYDAPGPAGTWVAYQGFTQIADSIQGPLTSSSFLAKAATSTVYIPGKTPRIVFADLWTSGPPGDERIFNHSVAFDEFDNGQYVVLQANFSNMTRVAEGLPPS